MFKRFEFSGRFSVVLHFILLFLAMSVLLRIGFMAWQFNDVSLSLFDILKTLLIGLFFDIGTINFIVLPSILYYVLLPNKWIGSKIDRFLVWFFTVLTLFILVFTFFAELTFWDEFKSRFNFIAVDYLIYTHEVVSNIQESYPLPLLVGGVLLLTALFIFVFYKNRAFHKTFTAAVSISQRFSVLVLSFLIAVLFVSSIRNNQAEWSSNRYNSEISKSGIYSFFAAFRNNQMKYDEFYTSIKNEDAFQLVKNKLKSNNSAFKSDGFSIHRTITDSSASSEKRNVVFILVESLSGSFMEEFGNTEKITPFLDSLA